MKDYLNYTGKICVVTGAASGIGRATATMLVDLGAKVYALDIREVTVPGIEAWVPTDLNDRASIDAAFTKLPEKIDCYFGIAGISGSKYTYVETITVHYISNRYITETYLETRLVDGGRICYVASQCARAWDETKDEYFSLIEAKTWEEMQAAAAELSKTMPSSFSYIVAKRALSFYSSMIVAHFSKRDIRVNRMIPCATKTNMMKEGIEDMGGDHIYRTYMCNDKEYAEPEWMANGLIYLNSDLATYVSGQEIWGDYGFEAATRTGQRPDDKGISIATMLAYGG